MAVNISLVNPADQTELATNVVVLGAYYTNADTDSYKCPGCGYNYMPPPTFASLASTWTCPTCYRCNICGHYHVPPPAYDDLTEDYTCPGTLPDESPCTGKKANLKPTPKAYFYLDSIVEIEIDTSSSFDSANKQVCTWPDQPLTSGYEQSSAAVRYAAFAVPSDGTWYWRAKATNIWGTATSETRSVVVDYFASNIKRALYQYENVAKYGPDWTQKRVLYQYENVAKYGPDWLKKRGLYQYENITDEPPFPYIERLSTTRTSQGSVVTIYGNGFGSKAASDPANADRTARGYGGAVYLGTKQCGIVSWSWGEITFTVPVDAVSGAVFVRLLTPEPPGQRDSSLKGLEIYEAPPTTDTGLELFVCDKNNPNTILDQLDAATEKSFYTQRNASGSGMFRISRLDVKGSDRALVTDQNFILCRLNGVDVFKWIIESRKPAYVDDSEEQWIDVSGRGNMAVLDQAIIYPEGMPTPTSLERTWVDTHGAAIFLQLFSEAKARGCFPYVTVDFTADHDSLGMPWTDYTDVSFHAGTKLGNVAEKLTTGFGLFDLYMTPTFVLRAYKGTSTYPGHGTNLANTVRFFKGQSILSHENQSDSTNIENVVLVEGDAGSLVEVTHTLTPSIDNYGRREGYLQARNVPDDWSQLASYGKIKADKSGQVAWGIRLATDFAFHKPFDTYNMGDWIYVQIEPEGSDTVGFDGEVRVVGITVTEDADLKLSAQLELNNIMLERELIMAQLLERLSMGSADPQMTNPAETPPAGIAHNHFHGLLVGLRDDDHQQYYNALRHADDPHSALARVTSIKKQGSDAMTGDVTLIPGSNVTLTQDTEQKTITIAASGGGGGSGTVYPINVCRLNAPTVTSPTGGNVSNVIAMFDGNRASSPYVNVGSGTQEMVLDFGAPLPVSAVKWWMYYADGRTFINVALYGSEDGLTWDTLRAPANYKFDASGLEVVLDPPVLYQYFKIHTEHSDKFNTNEYCEIEVYTGFLMG